MEKSCALFYNCPALSGFTEQDALFMTIKELVDNAVDACRHSKALFKHDADISKKKVSLQLLFDPTYTPDDDKKLSPQLTLWIKVLDNGSGIEHSTIEHLGTLFGSSKPPWCHPEKASKAHDSLPQSLTNKRVYETPSSSPESWLHSQSDHETLNVYEKSSSCENVPSGKFGLGLKMVLLASHRNGLGKLDFQIRVSPTSLANFRLKLNNPDSSGAIQVENLHYTFCHYNDWPWMTSVAVQITHTDIADCRVTNYFDLLALWNPEIQFTYEFDNTSLLQCSTITCKNSYDVCWFGLLDPHPSSTTAKTTTITWNPSLVLSLQERFSQRLHHQGYFVLQSTKISKSNITLVLFLCRHNNAANEQLTEETDYKTHLALLEDTVKIWSWKSCNRVPLSSGDSSICFITQCLLKFFKRFGHYYGIFNVACQSSVSNSDQFPDDSFFKMVSLLKTHRVAYATWTDLFMLINFDMEHIEYGSFSKSYIKGPSCIEPQFLSALQEGFLNLQTKCGNLCHELISVQKAQYLTALSKDAPILASSLATLIQNSMNSEFRKQMQEFIEEQEMFYGLTAISSGQDISLEQRFLKLLRKRLQDAYGNFSSSCLLLGLVYRNLFFIYLLESMESRKTCVKKKKKVFS
ncbi:uncharacterized protein LOC128883924 isoform X2 [Hylaeus volcanicus]|uniref:uncharacterized protein LOC128883924 isoform X2 n=1 Tax=Hylaeus volcanicus TaxID=313075 RepID=UPI0023B785D0|nr:uncharacterized protein LOC128883924 isoform X2 [Hylaeus volcanicus]